MNESKQKNFRILVLGEMVEPRSAALRILQTMSIRLAEIGHNVTFLHPAPQRAFVPRVAERKEGYVRIETPGLFSKPMRRGGFSVLDFLTKTATAMFGRFDIVHASVAHRPAQMLPSLMSKVVHGSTTVDEWWEWYDSDGRATLRTGLRQRIVGAYDDMMELRAKRLYSGTVAISSPLARRLPPDHKVVVLNGGAEVGKLTPYPIEQARQHLSLPSDWFIVGMVGAAGADHYDNGPFLDAFEQLCPQYPQLRLFITGEPKYIESELKSRPMGDRIIYPGWLEYEDYNRHLSACNLFSLPLKNIPRNTGRWPHRIGDFLALDRPVLSNPTGDLVPLFDSYRVGLLCPENAAGFGKVLGDILDGKIDLEEHHFDSLMVAREVLAFSRRVDGILEFYEQLSETD